MGEIADAMINGDDCQVCGVPFDDEGSGYPRTCASCSEDDDNEFDFKAMKQETKERHANWKIENTAIIEKSGLLFRKAGPETFVFRETGKPKVDFYPSTGRWRDLTNSKTNGGGANKFLEWYKNIK